MRQGEALLFAEEELSARRALQQELPSLYAETPGVDREQQVIEWMDRPPDELRAALLNTTHQQCPRGFAVFAAAASLQARVGKRADTVLDRQCRQAIRHVLVERDRRTGMSYLFDVAVPEVVEGDPYTADLLLVANSAQAIHPVSQPYRPGAIVRYIHRTPTNLDDSLLSLTGRDRPQRMLEGAVRRFVSNAPEFERVRSDAEYDNAQFASGSPLIVLLAQLAIVRRLDFYEGLDVRVADPIRTAQFAQLQISKEVALRPGDFDHALTTSNSHNYMKLLPPDLRREIEATGQFLEDRRAYRDGYHRVVHRKTRLWQGLSRDGSGWQRLDRDIRDMEERVPFLEASHGQSFNAPPETLGRRLEAALSQQDPAQITSLWAIIVQRRHNPHERDAMQALAKKYQRHVSEIAEPYAVDAAHLMWQGRKVPAYIAPLLADFYFAQHEKYWSYDPDHVAIFTPAYGSLAEDREVTARALRSRLPKSERYTVGSEAFDIAVAWHLVRAKRPIGTDDRYAQIAKRRFAMIVQCNGKPYTLTPRLRQAYEACHRTSNNGVGIGGFLLNVVRVATYHSSR